jgi:hypothetical protein
MFTSMGVPVAIGSPELQANILAHTQTSAVTTVIMMAVVLFCIGFSFEGFAMKNCWQLQSYR